MVNIFVTRPLYTGLLSKERNHTEKAVVIFSAQHCPISVVQFDGSSRVGYATAMFNAEKCVFVPTAYSRSIHSN
jgi:hypothetical protein